MTDESTEYDVVIAGQGAAGYAAALYAARYQMKAVVVGETFGGETALGGMIENYPGYAEIDGFELMMKFRQQAEKYQVPIVDDKIVQITRDDHRFESATAGGDTYVSSTVILGVGRERRKLGLEHEDEWTGKGVSFCSTCDAPLHRGNTVAVVGGGNAAVEGAVLISKYAEKVYIVYRQDMFTRPEPVNVQLLDQAANVEQLMSTSVIELKGDDNGLISIVMDRQHNGEAELRVDGIFIEIGADPRVQLANQLGVELNEKSEVVVDKHMRTSTHGVFAAGDLTDGSGDLKQTITAASQGAVAATSAYADVAEHPYTCSPHAIAYSLD